MIHTYREEVEHATQMSRIVWHVPDLVDIPAIAVGFILWVCSAHHNAIWYSKWMLLLTRLIFTVPSGLHARLRGWFGWNFCCVTPPERFKIVIQHTQNLILGYWSPCWWVWKLLLGDFSKLSLNAILFFFCKFMIFDL